MCNSTTEHHKNHVKILRHTSFRSKESVIFKFPSLQSIIAVSGNNEGCHDLYIYPGRKGRGQLRNLSVGENIISEQILRNTVKVYTRLKLFKLWLGNRFL
jgi:hypothetical protein